MHGGASFRHENQTEMCRMWRDSIVEDPQDQFTDPQQPDTTPVFGGLPSLRWLERSVAQLLLKLQERPETRTVRCLPPITTPTKPIAATTAPSRIVVCQIRTYAVPSCPMEPTT